MFAVIKTGGKQYRVAAEDRIVVMTLPGQAGAAVTFSDVLSLSGSGTMEIGTPFVAGATVAAEIVEQKRGPKVIAFKKRRRQNSRRKRGHRQDLTVVRITDILAAGQSPRVRVAADGVDSHAALGADPLRAEDVASRPDVAAPAVARDDDRPAAHAADASPSEAGVA